MTVGKRNQKFGKYSGVLLAVWWVGYLVFFLYSKNWRNAFLLGSPLIAIGVAYLISYVAQSLHSEPDGKKTEWQGASFLVMMTIYALLAIAGMIVFGISLDSKISITATVLAVLSILFLVNMAVATLIHKTNRNK